MRLGDLDALKKALINRLSEDDSRITEIIEEEIDNAPIVEYPFYAEAYQTGYEEGKNERPTGEWIPVKYRPLTTEERIDFAEYYGIEYSDTVDEKAFDCHMPDDGQEILISTRWGVSTDVADNDIIDGGYSTYGLEGNGDWEGIDAWMPLPEPYKEAENEQ
jgi:hypothetical protein